MKKRWVERACAAALAAGMLIASRAMADAVRGSGLYRRGRIATALLSEDSSKTPIAGIKDLRLLLSFTEGLAEAYVSFEHIPADAASSFVAVFDSLPPEAEALAFEYGGGFLKINGVAETARVPHIFAENLRESGIFTAVKCESAPHEKGAEFLVICEI
jgi:hypothetical protein